MVTMPKGIDVDARRTVIAQATLAVARREGVEATTIRAVARELGRSTVFITNYLGTRAELLLNALAHVERGWSDELDELAEASGGDEHLRALIRFSTERSEQDDAIRRMWLEVLSTPSLPAEVLGAVRLAARNEYDGLLNAVADAGRADTLGDILFLALRGFYTASVEDPERWDPDRARRVLNALVDLDRRIGRSSTP